MLLMLLLLRHNEELSLPQLQIFLRETDIGLLKLRHPQLGILAALRECCVIREEHVHVNGQFVNRLVLHVARQSYERRQWHCSGSDSCTE